MKKRKNLGKKLVTMLVSVGFFAVLITVLNSNFAHKFYLCTLKIQYLAVIPLSMFSFYTACNWVFNITGSAFINASTNSLIFSSDNSVFSSNIVRNI